MFTLFKIFSIGTDNREFYIYFSALVSLRIRVTGIRTFFFSGHRNTDKIDDEESGSNNSGDHYTLEAITAEEIKKAVADSSHVQLQELSIPIYERTE